MFLDIGQGDLVDWFNSTVSKVEPPACYRAYWQLPGPDFHRQTTSLRTRRNAMAYVMVPPPVLLDTWRSHTWRSHTLAGCSEWAHGRSGPECRQPRVW